MRKQSWKKLLAGLLAAALLPIAALPASAAVEGVVTVTQSGSKVVIGNQYISRTFSVAGGKLTTLDLTNKRTDGAPTVFTPGEGSEEFKVRVANVIPALDRTGWTATADSYQNETGASDGNAPNLIDGNVGSIWHTKYNNNGHGSDSAPYHVLFDLGKQTTFQCFSWTQRSIGGSNARTKGYELYYSTSETPLAADAGGWTLLKSGQFNQEGSTYVNLDTPCTARQLKLKVTSSWTDNGYAGGAEFNLHDKKDPAAGTDVRDFAASDLTLQGAPEVGETTAELNGQARHGQKVTFRFAPFTFRGVTYTITENIVMYDGDHFMRKYLEISVPEAQWGEAVIDYIDLESLVTSATDATWTIPTNAGGVVEMETFRANLGQPIYIQGMFLGCEFPVADTQIVNNVGYMRYYSGKSFTRFQKDNQLTQDGKYVTWQTVAGAARSTDNAVIQADFFEYIKSIATPSDFRIQYNSWFDNMMLISDENILKSFIEIDKELNATGVRPLDSYVVDDGWVNYNHTGVVDADRAGTTLNKTGFWEFNSKFPDGLTPSSELVHNFGSNFGVWVGPRGGYNFYGSLADILVANGTGSKAGGSIDVADRTYLKNFTEMAVKWMRDYGVNYWKWDGFADNGQYNTWPATDGVPGYANRHMTGGFNRMYHVTDLWEGWIDLMETVRQAEKELGIKKLWISLTCYVNPSPWYLQWANSVWIQCTADQADAGPSTSKMDRQMTYRDAMYYDFLKNHEFQFPLSNVYNHDPVYGVEGTGMNINTATDEQFKNYLYMLSTRGTAFWELYFSDSIMTPGKYEITAEFLAWAEENYHMLKNAKMFGQSPASGRKLGSGGDGTCNAYGFACFDGTDGLISFRNSASEAKSVTIPFDRTIGVPEDAGTLKYHIEHSYNLTAGTPTTGEVAYGDSVTVTLQPDEVRILRFSKTGDTVAPTLTEGRSDGDREFVVKFSEKVKDGTFLVNGQVAAATTADGATYHVTAPETALPSGKGTVTVTAQDVTDLAGNPLSGNTISILYYPENRVASTHQQVKGTAQLAAAADSFTGAGGFTLKTELATASQGPVVKQGSAYELGITPEGQVYFTFNGATAVTALKNDSGGVKIVNDGMCHQVVAAKENNGMVKLYVDGALAGSSFRESNRSFSVPAADITLGNANFYGDVMAEVLDTALGYDAVAADYNGTSGTDPADPNAPAVVNLAKNKAVTAKWADTGEDAYINNQRPLSMVTDGTKNTDNYGEFGNANRSVYIEVDLEEVSEISRLKLYRYWNDGRTYKGTVIALSETADFADATYVYSTDAENFHGLQGRFQSLTIQEAPYAETPSGKEIILSEYVSARYIRIYMHGSGANNYNHVVELEAYSD